MFLRLFLAASISFISVIAVSQNKADYFIHKVRGGETYKSIAAKYNLTGRELANYNNLEYYTGQLTAKTLRIPRKAAIKKPDTAKSTQDTASVNAGQQVPADTTYETQYTSPNPQYSAPADTIVVAEPAKAIIETSSFKKNLPVVLYISVSIILLIIAVIYYRFVSRN